MNDRIQLGTKQAAHALGVSPKTLHYWRKKGEGPPFYKLTSKLIVYKKEDLEEWLERCRCEN